MCCPLNRYLKESRGHNSIYAFTYLACEALNWLNVVVQMLLIDAFLGGVFLQYGLNVSAIPLKVQKTNQNSGIETSLLIK